MRFLAKLRARIGGYFWATCDVCGREFGGHERGNGTVRHADGRGTLTCPNCPGDWLARDGRLSQAGVWFDQSGEPQLMLRLPV